MSPHYASLRDGNRTTVPEGPGSPEEGFRVPNARDGRAGGFPER
jgi:hypothetical protein